MSVFSVEADLGPVQNALNALAARSTNLRPALLQIGEELLSSSQQRFVDERGPDGRAWTALSPAYRTSRGKLSSRHPDGILKRSGQMAENLFYDASASALTVGSPEVYAAIHQFGGPIGRGRGRMPARPFLGLSATDLQTISAIAEDHLEGN